MFIERWDQRALSEEVEGPRALGQKTWERLTEPAKSNQQVYNEAVSELGELECYHHRLQQQQADAQGWGQEESSVGVSWAAIELPGPGGQEGTKWIQGLCPSFLS